MKYKAEDLVVLPKEKLKELLGNDKQFWKKYAQSLKPFLSDAFNAGAGSGSMNWDSYTAPNIAADKKDYLNEEIEL